MGFLAGFDFLIGLDTEDLDAAEIVIAALHSAETNTPSVGSPFSVVNTESEDVIVYDRRVSFLESEDMEDTESVSQDNSELGAPM